MSGGRNRCREAEIGVGPKSVSFHLFSRPPAGAPMPPNGAGSPSVRSGVRLCRPSGPGWGDDRRGSRAGRGRGPAGSGPGRMGSRDTARPVPFSGCAGTGPSHRTDGDRRGDRAPGMTDRLHSDGEAARSSPGQQTGNQGHLRPRAGAAPVALLRLCRPAAVPPLLGVSTLRDSHPSQLSAPRASLNWSVRGKSRTPARTEAHRIIARR